MYSCRPALTSLRTARASADRLLCFIIIFIIFLIFIIIIIIICSTTHI